MFVLFVLCRQSRRWYNLLGPSLWLYHAPAVFFHPGLVLFSFLFQLDSLDIEVYIFEQSSTGHLNDTCTCLVRSENLREELQCSAGRYPNIITSVLRMRSFLYEAVRTSVIFIVLSFDRAILFILEPRTENAFWSLTPRLSFALLFDHTHIPKELIRVFLDFEWSPKNCISLAADAVFIRRGIYSQLPWPFYLASTVHWRTMEAAVKGVKWFWLLDVHEVSRC